MHTIAGFLRDPEWARIVPALLLLKSHERGIADGTLRADLVVPEAMAQLVGPLIFAFLTSVVPIDDGFIDRFHETHRGEQQTLG